MNTKSVLMAALLSGFVSTAALAQTAPPSADPVVALGLMARGDNWLGANVMQRAVDQDESPQNRFNLATGYLRTNRLIEARRIFQDLAISGQAVELTADPSPLAARGAERRFNLAAESASRLLYIDWRLGQSAGAPTFAAGGARSADLAGVAASAAVTGEVSDDRARQLDAVARLSAD